MINQEVVQKPESELSPELQEYVRSEAFKEWFGDWENNLETSSKIVAENGEPKLVYFGGPAGIERLSGDRRSRTGSDEIGFYFTDIRRNAKFYAETLRDLATDNRVPSSVYAAFLNIRNPYIKQTGDGVQTERVTEMLDGHDGFINDHIREIVAVSPNQVMFISEEPVYTGGKKAPISSVVEIPVQ